METEITIPQIIELARKTIQTVTYSFFLTHDPAGHINARLVQHFPPEDDLTLWFGTSPKSRKVNDLRLNPHMTVTFEHDPDFTYLTLIGTGEIVDSLEARRQHWFETWQAFFPAGPEGDDYVLVRFHPARLEMMSFAHKITPPPFGLRSMNLVRAAGEWQFEAG